MGILAKFKDLVGLEEIDDDDDSLEDDIKAAEEKLERKTIEPRNSYSSSSRQDSKDGKVLPIQNRPANPNTNAFKLVVIEPKGFDECPKLVDNLKSKKPVIINLEKIESDTARKIFDFLSGATYALNGNVQKIANNIFVFAPENVDIAASVDHKGIDFGGNQKSLWR